MIVKASQEHIDAIYADMRVFNTERFTPDYVRVILSRGIEESLESFTLMTDGRPSVIWGYHRNELFNPVSIWMITSNQIDSMKVEFLRRSWRETKRAFETYGPLYGYAQERHEVAKRWLEWLGFKVDKFFPELGHFRYQLGLR